MVEWVKENYVGLLCGFCVGVVATMLVKDSDLVNELIDKYTKKKQDEKK